MFLANLHMRIIRSTRSQILSCLLLSQNAKIIYTFNSSMKFLIEILLFNSQMKLSKEFDSYKDAKKAFRFHRKHLDDIDLKYEITLFKYEE